MKLDDRLLAYEDQEMTVENNMDGALLIRDARERIAQLEADVDKWKTEANRLYGVGQDIEADRVEFQERMVLAEKEANRRREEFEISVGRIIALEAIGADAMDKYVDVAEKNDALQRQAERFKEEVGKLKHHLSPEGEYSITRSDGEPMSWESLIVSNIFLELDELLK